MYLAFPPILGGYSTSAYIVLGVILCVVIAVFVLVYRMLKRESGF